MMRKVEQMLAEKKLELDRLEIPPELETRLRSALENRIPKIRARNNWKVKLAAGCIALMLIGYNFDALAFYGMKLIGYDQVMNGDLKQLNELGRGQVIGKSYSFQNGVTFTLDGIMLDGNQLLAFYIVKDSNGHVDKVNIAPFMTIRGLFAEYSMQNAQGEMNKDRTEIKYIASFEAPLFFEKRLHLNFSLPEGGVSESGDIAFTLDRSKAMGYTLKKVLGQTVEVDETKIRFESIAASPTKTVVEGSIQNIVELAADQIKGERFRPNKLEVKLIANGEAVPQQGGGMSTDMKGITFHQDYDSLPANLETLQIELVSFAADHDVERQIKLQKGMPDRSVSILGQQITIKGLYESKGNTCVTVTTEESVVLTRVYLMIDGQRAALKETIAGQLEKKPDGTIIRTRTLLFSGTGRDLQLNIQRMMYQKAYNRVLYIPLD